MFSLGSHASLGLTPAIPEPSNSGVCNFMLTTILIMVLVLINNLTISILIITINIFILENRVSKDIETDEKKVSYHTIFLFLYHLILQTKNSNS